MITFTNGIIRATNKQPPLDDWRAAMLRDIADSAPVSPGVRAALLGELEHDAREEVANWEAFVAEVEGGR